jgi:osmotically-inducible protein OsmY
MKPSDDDIRRDVEKELEWDPEIDPTDIAVVVRDGVVMLTGFVKEYPEIGQAATAAKRVVGVLGVANDLELRIPGEDPKPDPEIAREVLQAIRFEWPSLSERIRLTAKDGWITLEGEVEWNYQRERVESALRRVRGLRGVSNLIEVKPRLDPEDSKRLLEEALRRNAGIDANRIVVETNDGVITLKGRVPSWAERREVERIAWSAPGVTRVENFLAVGW